MPVHHHVDHAVIAQIFRFLETFRQFLANSLLDNAWTGEADQCAGLRDMNVAKHCI